MRRYCGVFQKKAMALLLAVLMIASMIPTNVFAEEPATTQAVATVETVPPEVTAKPEATQTPEATAAPEATAEPDATAVPDPTEVPEETEQPETTPEEEGTQEPTPEPTVSYSEIGTAVTEDGYAYVCTASSGVKVYRNSDLTGFIGTIEEGRAYLCATKYVYRGEDDATLLVAFDTADGSVKGYVSEKKLKTSVVSASEVDSRIKSENMTIDEWQGGHPLLDTEFTPAGESPSKPGDALPVITDVNTDELLLTQEVLVGTQLDELDLPAELEATIADAESETRIVPIRWEGEYDSEQTGVYILNAVLDSDAYTLGCTLPNVTVIVLQPDAMLEAVALEEANGDTTLINLVDINAITTSLFEVKPQGAANFLPVPLPDGTILHVGDEVHIRFDYTTLDNVTPNNVYYFDIPAGLSAITGQSRGDIKDGATVIGSYWVDDGKVKMQFDNEEYLDETGNEITGGFVNFYARLNQTAVDNEGVIKIGDTVIGTLPIEADEDITNVNLKKWNGDGTDAGSELVYDANRNAVQYTFSVDTIGNNTSVDTITVVDTLTTTVNGAEDTSIVTGDYQDITITPSGAATFTKGADGKYVLTANNVAKDTTIKVTYWVPVKAGIVQANFVNDVEVSKTVGGTTTVVADDSVQGTISNNLQINKRNQAPVFDPDTATTTVTYTVTVTAPETNTTDIPDAYVEDTFTINGDFVKSVEKLSGDGTFGPLTTGDNANFRVDLGNMAPGTTKTYTYKATLDTNKCYFYNAPDGKWFDNWATAKSGDLEFDKSKASIRFEKQFTEKTGTYDSITGKYRFILTFDGTIPGTNNEYYDKVLKSFADEITASNATYSGTPAPVLEAMKGNNVVKTATLDGTKIDGKTSFDLDVPTDMQGEYSYRLTYYVNLPAGASQTDTVKNRFTVAPGIGPGGAPVTFESTSTVSSGSAANNAMSKRLDEGSGTRGIAGNNEYGINYYSIKITSPLAQGATLTDWVEQQPNAMVDILMPLDFLRQTMTVKYNGANLVEGVDYSLEAVDGANDKFKITFLKDFPGITETNPVQIDYQGQVTASANGKEMAQNPGGGKVGNEITITNKAQLNNNGLITDKSASSSSGAYIEKKAVNTAGMDVPKNLIAWDVTMTSGYMQAFATGYHPLVDTIPANQELVKVESFVDNATPQPCSTDAGAQNGYSAVVNGDGTTTVTINAYSGHRNHPYTYRIWTRIKDSALIAQNINPDNFDDVEFTNSAYYETAGTKWNVSAKTTVSRHNNEKTFKYNAETEGQGGVEFTLNINTEGLNMDALKDTITINDTMNKALTLKADTLRINGKTIDQIPGASLTYSEGSNKFTLELPDETPFTVTYVAEIDAEAGEAGWLSNEAYIEGRYGTISTDSIETERLDVSAGSSSTLTFYLKKLDGNGKLLSNAKFQLRKVELVGGQIVETPVTNAAHADGVFFDFHDGTYKFRGVEKGVIYAVEETAAPEGCIKDSAVHYIYFGTPDAAVQAALTADGKQVEQGHTGGASNMNTMFAMVNTDAKTQVKVTKKWVDGDNYDNTRPSSIQVQLKADDVVIDTATVGGTGNTWEHTFTDLPTHVTLDDTTRRAIVYSIEEVTVPAGYTSVKTGSAEEGYIITNTHDIPKKAEMNFSGTKKLTENGQAKPMTDGQFKFTVTEGGNNPAPIEGLPTQAIEISADGSFSLGKLAFVKSGTYTFTVSEVNEGKPGYTYDGHPVEVTVPVTVKAEDNSLVIGTVTYSKNGTDATGIVFENTYQAAAATVEIPVKKTLTGNATPNDKDFIFTIAAVTDGAPLPDETTVTITGAGEDAFNAITFDAAGEYSYSITETNGGEPGYSYDTTVHTVNVSVVDNNGSLQATWTVDGEAADNVEFENSYEPTAANLTLPVTKAIGLVQPQTDADFTFTLSAVTENAPLPGETTLTITGANTVSFGDISYTEAGTYTYKLVENAGNEVGYTYDATEYEITVEVTDNNGVLSAAWTAKAGNAAADALVFTNNYKPLDATLIVPVEKVIQYGETDEEDTGDLDIESLVELYAVNEAPEAKTFTFNMAALTGNGPLPDPATITIDGAGQASFAPITFDTVGTYQYTITEEEGNEPGYTYDTTAQIITVTVVDKDGKLEVTWKPNANPEAQKLTFTNIYTPAATTVEIPVKKTITGNATPNDKDFTFTIAAVTDEAPLPDETTVTITGAGEDAFHAITFTAAGEYSYSISETNGGEPGYSYDTTVHTVNVSVVDNNGSLQATWTVDGEAADNVEFENSYEPTAATLKLPVTKAIQYIQPQTDADFTFTLSAVTENAPLPGETTLTITGANTASFGDISYTEAGTYTYKLVENAGNEVGYTYDATEYEITVEVTDNNGVLSAAWTAKAGNAAADALVFTNNYKPLDAALIVPVEKVIEGNETPADKTFTFNMTAKSDNAPLPNPATITIDGAGQASFAAITFDTEGTYKYAISEAEGNEPGYTYDTAEQTITVTVADNNGQLEVTWAADADADAQKLTFTNTYTPATATLEIPVKKTLTGNATPNDKDFTFTIAAVTDGAPLPDETTVTITGAGEDTFNAITFTAAGEYSYSITETNGGEDGYTYDTVVRTVKATVTDNNGQLEATWALEGDDTATTVEFTNAYAPETAEATISVVKEITGQETPEDKVFTFELTAKTDGAPMPDSSTVTITGAGNASFAAITFDTAGEYRYELAEQNSGEPGYGYDATVRNVLITVTDVDAALQAEVKIDDENTSEATFVNVYSTEDAMLSLPVEKVIEGDETPVDKEFTFTLTAQDGAPMPEDAENNKSTVSIFGSGNSAFG